MIECDSLEPRAFQPWISIRKNFDEATPARFMRSFSARSSKGSNSIDIARTVNLVIRKQDDRFCSLTLLRDRVLDKFVERLIEVRVNERD